MNTCLTNGERFAVVDDYGLVWILTPEEVDLSRAFNPKAFETRAFSVQYFKEAPKIPPLAGTPARGHGLIRTSLSSREFAGIALIVPRAGPPPSPAPAPGTAAEIKLVYPGASERAGFSLTFFHCQWLRFFI